ncbi:hypothetical protein FHY56_13125 [Brucella gallinifaecis]|uniref:B transposition protein C-terminal domain-containing protein n=1 Tax=Brucella gallinifaecis TaxID=215590 RepID=A0A502BLG3_9HYPH|nr:hypothetical protein FHY56_13125 [Brucella gallinifaecis]
MLGTGMKGDVLRQIDKTIKLASMGAHGNGHEVTLSYVKKAWTIMDQIDLAAGDLSEGYVMVLLKPWNRLMRSWKG